MTPGRPEICIFLGLILVLLPASVGLFMVYSSTVRSSAEEEMAPLPRPEELLARLREIDSGIEGTLELIHAPTPESRSGIVQVYTIGQNPHPRYELVVFRHDIACMVCEDVVAVAVYSPIENKWVRVFLARSWEAQGKEVDTEAFLTQFEGHPLDVPLVLGNNVDGITGATKSCRGLVEQLNRAAQWVNERRETAKALSKE